MKSMLISFILGACIACGTSELPRPEQENPPAQDGSGPQVDSQLKVFVENFLEDCEARRTDCAEKLDRIRSIRIVEMPDLDTQDKEVTIGLCYDNLFNRRIEINKDIMDNSYIYIKVLIYHEIGHCAYGLDHEKKENMLMSPVMPGLAYIWRNWRLMLDDYFAAIHEKHGD
jgi:hypothetical protein